MSKIIKFGADLEPRPWGVIVFHGIDVEQCCTDELEQQVDRETAAEAAGKIPPHTQPRMHQRVNERSFAFM
jgi:hypothetical protein